jgi:predicted ATPase
VVVGEVGSGSRQEQLALGATPNLAARLQGLATPDTVLISAATFQLVQGYFTSEDLGVHTLRGVAAPVHVYRMLSERRVQSRLEAVAPSQLTPLVGRDEEVALLHRRWAQAQTGLGQVVLLSGEAGIGKSRLVQVLKDHVAHEPHARIEWRGSAYHQQSALYPVIDQLHRLLRWHPDEPPSERLHTLEAVLATSGVALAEAVPLLAALLSLPLSASYPPLTLPPQRQRQHTFTTLLAWLHAEARRWPVLVIVEDLHWVDPSTLELLSLLVDQSAQARLCLVLTARPEFHPPWTMMAHVTSLTLRRFAPAEVERVARHVAGEKTLPPAVLQEVVRKTDGVPLFVEELTKTVLASGLLQEREDRYELCAPLPPLAIPATLHDALLARLDRLAAAKVVAQLGAVIERTFPYDLLQAVTPLDTASLQGALAQLVEAEVVAQRGLPPQATYTFTHALIQDVAYQALLKSTRQQYHHRIAQALEQHVPDTAARQPELVAQHYTEAGLGALALPYWQRAGQGAIARSANMEAISHLTTALALLRTLPDTPARTQQELEVHLALGTPLVLTKAMRRRRWKTTYARACELCQQLGDTPQLFAALLGLRRYYFTRGELPTARDLAEQLLRLAQRLDDRGLVVRAHHMLEEDLLFLGEFAQVRAHAEQGIALYDPAAHRSQVFRYGNDSGVGCRIFAAVALWALGYPDQAVQRSDEALAWAQELAHPFNLVFALTHAARLHLFRREPHRVLAWADAAVTLAREQSFAQFLAQASMLRGWALVEQGQAAAGLAQLRQGMTAWRATGAHPRPLDFALLAGMYGQMAQPAEGLRVLAEAQAVAETRREQFWAAELHRLRGALVLQSGGRAQQSGVSTSPMEETEVERCFCQALDIARRQQAKSLELRAAMSLARLWQQQGKRAEAHALLAPIYNWFTEGFDTADLQEAKALLEELGG